MMLCAWYHRIMTYLWISRLSTRLLREPRGDGPVKSSWQSSSRHWHKRMHQLHHPQMRSSIKFRSASQNKFSWETSESQNFTERKERDGKGKGRAEKKRHIKKVRSERKGTLFVASALAWWPCQWEVLKEISHEMELWGVAKARSFCVLLPRPCTVVDVSRALFGGGVFVSMAAVVAAAVVVVGKVRQNLCRNYPPKKKLPLPARRGTTGRSTVLFIVLIYSITGLTV